MTTQGSDFDRSPDDSDVHEEADGRLRLHKILAHRGVASRRKSEQLIAAGSVTVDGEVVTEPGTRVDPKLQEILVDGRPLPREPETFLFLFYKPKGVVSTLFDPEGRPTLREYFPGVDPLLHIGRLDFQTEGALLLTNNGDLSQRILHPRFEIPRTYLVKIQGGLSPAHLERMARGEIRLDGRPVLPLELVLERQTSTNAWYRITLTEGRNREVRRLFETLNYFVLKLVRTAFGPLTLAGLEPGEYRTVTPQEIELLLAGTRPQSLPKNLDSRFSRDSPRSSRKRDGETPPRARKSRPEEGREEEDAGERPARRPTGYERTSRTQSDDTRGQGFPKPRRTFDDRPGPRTRKFAGSEQPERPARERFERAERPERGSTRESTGAASRPDRRFSGEIDERPIPRTRKFAGSDRPAPSSRPERSPRFDRPERPERAERPARSERPEKPPFKRSGGFSSREDRPERAPRERSERFRTESRPREDRAGGSSSRPERRYSGEIDDRPIPRTKKFANAARPEPSERPDRPRSERSERPERPERSNRVERSEGRPFRKSGGFSSREERPERSRRESNERTERPAFREGREEGRSERPRRPAPDGRRPTAPRTSSFREKGREERTGRPEAEGRRERSSGEDRKPRESPGRYERTDRPDSRRRSFDGPPPRKSSGPSSAPRRPSSGSSSRGSRPSGPGKRGGRR